MGHDRAKYASRQQDWPVSLVSVNCISFTHTPYLQVATQHCNTAGVHWMHWMHWITIATPRMYCNTGHVHGIDMTTPHTCCMGVLGVGSGLVFGTCTSYTASRTGAAGHTYIKVKDRGSRPYVCTAKGGPGGSYTTKDSATWSLLEISRTFVLTTW